MPSAQLRVSEIFLSLQGETSTTGFPTVFVRLTGCPLRCGYCDTAYAFQGGSLMALEEIMKQIAGYGVQYVTVTGGEPLAQPDVHILLEQLCDQGHRVSLETGGAISVANVDPRVVTILDLKTPGSGECERNLFDNLQHLKAGDEIKFVICDRRDYDWVKEQLSKHELLNKAFEILLSPVAGELAPHELAGWVVEDRLPVRMQVQLHKILWGDERAR